MGSEAAGRPKNVLRMDREARAARQAAQPPVVGPMRLFGGLPHQAGGEAVLESATTCWTALMRAEPRRRLERAPVPEAVRRLRGPGAETMCCENAE